MKLLGVLIFTGIGIIFLVGALAISWLISPPSRPQGDKFEPYECGNLPFGEGRLQFTIRYYFYALLFLLFELEAVFLIPWAFFFRKLVWLGVIEGLIFLLILLVAFFFAWKEGVLSWLRLKEI
jgi:NADH-quinone oxidoreductase subunit A